ncbi:hypothetical protein [Salinicola rhizosphaerae]|uniref:DUF4136 domain-containing protein n=1 Tax=Salinicola rhizosphaerae TaxID=1443141 RepID=A0ABQ3EJ78_9GAMM|nr:hypothetical protein [Salinicola rhizosphaerae]GHB32471.1 hypothetical protein GCM10009038_34150 [Salinicola rhizosphaerae]
MLNAHSVTHRGTSEAFFMIRDEKRDMGANRVWSPGAAVMKTFGIVAALLASLVLGGCQSISAPGPVDPAGGNALPAACRWPATGETLDRLRATRDALESQGYAILDTDAKLGLVSAERKTAQPGLGAVDRPFGRSGFWGGFGLGGHHGYSLGVIQGFGGGYNTDPIQIERVSVVTPDATTLVDRDSVVVDYNGYLIDARSWNQPSFCQQLKQGIESRLNPSQGAGGGLTP